MGYEKNIDKKNAFTCVAVCLLFLYFLFTSNTSAASPITDAIVTGFENATWEGVYNTYFDVSISYDSTNYTCSVSGRFHCIDIGAWYLRPGYSTRYTTKDNGNGDYTVTMIYNGDWLGNDVQRAQGTVHCDAKKVTLTAYAVTEYKRENGKGYYQYLKTDGTVSDWLDSAPDDALVQRKETNYGGSASVKASDFDSGRYEFTQWGSSCGSTADDMCTKTNLTGSTYVYAYYKMKEFKGQASVTSGGETETTGFVNVDKKDTDAALLKVNCPESGCNATFTLSLMSEFGFGETTYTIYENDK